MWTSYKFSTIEEKYNYEYMEERIIICPKIIKVAKYDSNKHLQAELPSYDASYATGENVLLFSV